MLVTAGYCSFPLLVQTSCKVFCQLRCSWKQMMKHVNLITICSGLCNLCSLVISVEYLSWNSIKQTLGDSQSYAEIYGENPVRCSFTKMNFFKDISPSFFIWGLYLNICRNNHFLKSLIQESLFLITIFPQKNRFLRESLSQIILWKNYITFTFYEPDSMKV